MSTLAIEVEPLAVDVSCTDAALHVVLADRREISVPLTWSPRLLAATPEDRKFGVLLEAELGFTGTRSTKIFRLRVYSG